MDDPNLVAIKILELPRVIVASKDLVSHPKKYTHPEDLKDPQSQQRPAKLQKFIDLIKASTTL